MRTILNRHLDRPRFALLLALFAALLLGASPELRADAHVASSGTEPVSVLAEDSDLSADRVIVTGAPDASPDSPLAAGQKVTLYRDGGEEYASTRDGESVLALLRRLSIRLDPLELVVVALSDDGVTVRVGSELTFYETAREAVAHTTLYTPTSRLPKGETEVVQQGIDGTREVTYEVVYSGGALVSRQAVAEENNTSVPELAYLGTLVTEAQEGDSVASVVRDADGGGYLVMASGDTLRFTKAIEVKCTAYTAGHDGVDTCTATGTTVRRGVVAVDKRVIPLGSTLYVDVQSDAYQYGMAYAEDTGIRGEKLDLYMDSYEECIQFGVRKAVAYILA